MKKCLLIFTAAFHVLRDTPNHEKIFLRCFASSRGKLFVTALLSLAAAMPLHASELGSAPGFWQSTGQNGCLYLASDSDAAGVRQVSATPEPAQPASGQVYSPFVDFKEKYDAWLAMVHRTHEEEQPDWMTPVVTVTPTLQQEIRTDFSLSTSRGLETDTFLSKGTEIIPTENTEFIFGNPSWVTKDLSIKEHKLTEVEQVSGWADWFTLFKYRLLSSPSTACNYVVTFMLQATFDTGSTKITAGHDVITPMLGFGKGIKTPIGEFVYQGSVGPSIPSAESGKLGTPVTWNSAFQYGNRFCIGGYTVPLWPEFEVTWVSYPNGEHSGQQQVYLTPGLNIGRFRLSEHTYFVVGAGYEFAATTDRSFDHQWLVTMRIPYF